MVKISKILRLAFALLLLAPPSLLRLRAQEPAPEPPVAAATATATAAPDEAKEKEEKVIPLDQEKWTPNRAQRRRVARQTHSGGPVFGANIVVKPNESMREVVLLGGDADIQGNVDRDVVVIGGNAKVSGTVGGCVVVIGGTLTCSGDVAREAVVVLGSGELSDTAHIGRSGVFIGGPFSLAAGASIGDQRVVIPLGDVISKVAFIKEWFIRGPLMGRLLPIGIRVAWAIAGILAALYFVALLVFPRAVKSVYLALEERPVASILSGMLTLILFGPLVIILLVSVIGIAVIPFLKIGLILALIFGKIGVICFIGRSLGRASGASALQAPLLAFVLGTLLLLLAYMTPLIGITVWMMATVFGLGGAVVALTQTFKREENYVPLAPVSVPRTDITPAQSSPTSAAAPSSNFAMGIASGGTSEPGASTATATATAVNPPLVQPPPRTGMDTVLMPRAGFWRRFLAALLDFIPLAFLIPLLHVAFIPAAVAYFVGMWTWKGTTLGSLIMGLKIVRTDGGPVTFSVALVRCLSSFFSAIVLFLGFFWIGWDRNK
ncbi:MAG TPA: RDD family protein, partial [Verrucomicrobiae bacterium]|nr:RDD family protein [Verrucomicrobiae bacterium]